jgi:hypothetical protein
LFLKIKTGYKQTDEGGVNRHYKSNKKQTIGTYAFNIYGWLICKPTVPQRTIESKTNMQTYSGSFAYCKVFIQVGWFWRGNQIIIYRFYISKWMF